ncbi:MAG: NUDIX domain-containing protein [Halodesulfurarchaeum sp.]
METRRVVTVFLSNAGSVLLARRSEAVSSYPGRWAAVAGHIEDEPETAAIREIREETGLRAEAVSLIARGEAFTVTDEALQVTWEVHPFRFAAATREVEPNWETTEFEWVRPTAIRDRETVPQLWTSWERVRPTLRSVRSDGESGAATISRRALEVLRDEAALLGESGAEWTAVADLAESLREARESMAVLQVRIDRAMATAFDRTPAAVSEAAQETIEHSVAADQEAATVAAERLDGAGVFTLSRSSTVDRALEQADPETVAVAISRPGGEGQAVANHLAERGLAVTIVEDSAIPVAVASAEVVLLGADTILSTGDVINKTGSAAGALAAARRDVPVLVASATAKVGPTAHAKGHPSLDAPETRLESTNQADGHPRYAPRFERVPADLIDGFCTEAGLLEAPDLPEVADRHASWADWRERSG